MLLYSLKCRKKRSKVLWVAKINAHSNLWLKTHWSKILLVGDILFWRYKMNEIVNKFWLAVDTFIPEMYLRQHRFIYSACGPFTKNKERMQ